MLARRLPAAGSTATLPLGPPQSRTCVRLWTVREGSDSHPSDGIGRLPSWRGPSTRSEDHGPMVTPAEAPGAARASHARTPAPPPPREDQPRRFRRPAVPGVRCSGLMRFPAGHSLWSWYTSRSPPYSGTIVWYGATFIYDLLARHGTGKAAL